MATVLPTTSWARVWLQPNPVQDGYGYNRNQSHMVAGAFLTFSSPLYPVATDVIVEVFEEINDDWSQRRQLITPELSRHLYWINFLRNPLNYVQPKTKDFWMHRTLIHQRKGKKVLYTQPLKKTKFKTTKSLAIWRKRYSLLKMKNFNCVDGGKSINPNFLGSTSSSEKLCAFPRPRGHRSPSFHWRDFWWTTKERIWIRAKLMTYCFWRACTIKKLFKLILIISSLGPFLSSHVLRVYHFQILCHQLSHSEKK